MQDLNDWGVEERGETLGEQETYKELCLKHSIFLHLLVDPHLTYHTGLPRSVLWWRSVVVCWPMVRILIRTKLRIEKKTILQTNTPELTSWSLLFRSQAETCPGRDNDLENKKPFETEAGLRRKSLHVFTARKERGN